jgi:hypothetical protein
MSNLLRSVKITPVLETTASGTSTTSGAVLDMSGWDGVAFVAMVDATNTGNHLRAEIGTASSAVNRELASVRKEFQAKSAAIEIYRPQHRFIRPVVRRSEATCIASVIAIQYKGGIETSHTGTATGTTPGSIWASPNTGSATD